MSKEDWFDWSEYQRGGKKKGAGSYGMAVRRSAANIASGKKLRGSGAGARPFSPSVQKVAAALAKKFNTRGQLRKGVPANASADSMQSAPKR